MENDNFGRGHTQVPHKIGNLLPLLGLNGRAYRVVSLIIRLTYGCQRRWAKLKYADLQVVGIAAPHAHAVIDSLISKSIITQNGTTKEYRLNEEYLSSEVTKTVSPELEKLRSLVGRQLKKQSYQSSNQDVAKSVTEALPKEENLGYQSSNDKGLLDREVTASNNSGFVSLKDNLNKKINKSIDKEFIGNTSSREGSEYKQKVNPYAFFPMDERAVEAKNAWLQLEPDKMESFDFYLWAVEQDLPASKFREFTQDIKADRKIRNKGAAFVTRVKEYLKYNA